jgi:alginate O-acetyltransferase complex protein AlgI
VSLFPQLVAGPIVRYEEVQDQLVNKQISFSNFSYGIERFVKGLFKKIFIANNLAYVSDIGFETAEGYGTLINWICIILFTLYVYYDVSGYSDMAIGLGKMLGFNFPENFNYPYLASSIQDFWRRWHITMSSWFKDYVYISLGGNRKSERRILINIFIVFAVTGLWHGSAWNFIFWGIWHGIFLIFEKLGLLNFIPKQLRNIYVLLVVIFGLVIFRTDNLSHALIFISKMFIYTEVYDFNILNFYFRNEIILATILAIIFSFPVYSKLKNTIKIKVSNEYFKLSLKLVSISIILLVCYTYIAIGAYNPFIYFRF